MKASPKNICDNCHGDSNHVYQMMVSKSGKVEHQCEKLCTTCVTAALNALNNRRLTVVFGRGVAAR